MSVYTVQLMSKLTLMCTEHACVLQIVLSQLMCDTQWAACKSSFLYCMRATFCALYTIHISYAG